MKRGGSWEFPNSWGSTTNDRLQVLGLQNGDELVFAYLFLFRR